jgi:hypothetical protein
VTGSRLKVRRLTKRQNAITLMVESAARLGVELNETEALDWIKSMKAESKGGDIVVDVDSGMFAHRATMLDLSPEEIERYRKVANVVGLVARDNVKTALALSGSAAQSRIQLFPSDLDFFERVHISAPSREEAYAILADVIHEKAIATMRGPTYRLAEVKFGTWDRVMVKNGKEVHPGAPIAWTPAEVSQGELTAVAPDGGTRTITWADAMANPGWCKIDWIVADTERGQLSNASNVLDATWEDPDGKIVALDGFLDPYYQEVYLDASSREVVERIVRDLSDDAVDLYIAQLEHEVVKYSTEQPNWGKVARRLYNIFRLTGRLTEAAFIRELFDEPTTALYQIAALLRTLDDAAEEGSPFSSEVLVSQVDQLIMAAIGALSGPSEQMVVSHLLRLRDELSGRTTNDRKGDIGPLRDETMSIVNAYFREKLLALPAIAEYVDKLTQTAAA